MPSPARSWLWRSVSVRCRSGDIVDLIRHALGSLTLRMSRGVGCRLDAGGALLGELKLGSEVCLACVGFAKSEE